MSVMQSKNYMGVIVVNHYTSETPVEFVGAQLPSPSVTEVAIYSASRNTETGEIVRGELISSVRMSDLQFGQMIGRPNSGEGQLVTLEHLSRYNTLPINKNEDPAEEQIKNEVANLLEGGANGQVARFFKELVECGDTIVERGRMTKADEAFIKKYTEMVGTYVRNSENYSLNKINQMAAQRVNEAKSSIHNTIRDAYRLGDDAVKLIETDSVHSDELPTVGAAAFMGISIDASGKKMFDDVNVSGQSASIVLRGARLLPPCDVFPSSRFFPERNFVSVSLSLEQYARFVRADKAEVSCTIEQLYADDIDEFDSSDSRDVKLEASIDESELYNGYLDKVAEITKGMDAGSYKGKAGMRELLGAIKDAKNAYEGYLSGTGEYKEQALSQLLKSHQSEVEGFFKDEIKSLPDSVRGKIVKPLSAILPNVGLLRYKK